MTLFKQLLLDLPFCQRATAETLENLLLHATEVQYTKDQYITRQYHAAETFSFLVKGSVQFFIRLDEEHGDRQRDGRVAVAESELGFDLGERREDRVDRDGDRGRDHRRQGDELGPAESVAVLGRDDAVGHDAVADVSRLREDGWTGPRPSSPRTRGCR